MVISLREITMIMLNSLCGNSTLPFVFQLLNIQFIVFVYKKLPFHACNHFDLIVAGFEPAIFGLEVRRLIH